MNWFWDEKEDISWLLHIDSVYKPPYNAIQFEPSEYIIYTNILLAKTSYMTELNLKGREVHSTQRGVKASHIAKVNINGC